MSDRENRATGGTAEARQESPTMSAAPHGPRRGPGGPGGHGMMMGGPKAKDFKGTVRRMLAYLGQFKLQLAAALLFAIGACVFNVIGPKVLSTATTTLFEGITGKIAGTGAIDFSKVARILLTTLGIYLVSAACQFVQGWMMTSVSQRTCYRLRRDITEKIDRMPMGYFESTATGDVLSRITNDVDTLGQSLNQGVTQLVTSAVTLVGVLVMMLTISPLMTLVTLVILPVSALLTKAVVSRSQRYFRAQQATLGAINAQVEETFSGQAVVRAFGQEQRAIATFSETNERLYESAWKSQFLSGLMMPAMNMVANLGYVAVAILGSTLAVRGVITVGDIQAFIQYVKNFTQPITQLAQVSNVLQMMAAAAERIFAFLDEPEEVDAYDQAGEDRRRGVEGHAGERGNHARVGRDERDSRADARSDERTAGGVGAAGGVETAGGVGTAGGGASPTPEALEARPHAKAADVRQARVEFDHVSFGYTPERLVIHDFSASVEPGSTVALVGPTGAGKTTMVKLLMRFYDVSGGAIRIDDHDVRDFDRSDLRSLFGMVLQDTWLFKGTIRENIRYGRLDATDEEVEEAAKAAFAHHFIMALPDGYDTQINEDASNISQGQRQLLTIARAILADRRMLILDEATSSVDTRTEERIQAAMDNLMRGRTSFVIAHRLSTIRNADLILVMRDGDIIEQGTHDELLSADGFYADLYRSQFTES